MSLPAAKPATPKEYFVVMIDLGHPYGAEAVVHPELSRADVVASIADGNYPADNILFVQHIVHGCIPVDVKAELINEAEHIQMREAA